MAACFYEILLQETLDERWSLWFEGLELCPSESSGTLLRGALPDKAALHSLLNRIYDLNLSLISVQRLEAPNRNLNLENKS